MPKITRKIYPVRKNGRFYFDYEDRPESFLFGTIPQFFSVLNGRKKRMAGKIASWVSQSTPVHASNEPIITWLGHATFLIQIGGVNILTDPIFGNASFLFPRILPVGLSIDELPQIDVILISHNHPDHMDSPSLKALKSRFPDVSVYVPFGDKQWFDKKGFVKPVEHMWWQETVFSINKKIEGVRFTFLPAAHWSKRSLFDTNKSLWGSWMIQWKDHTVYFGGDTAYSHHFKVIADNFPSIDVALLPIAPGEPHEWMKRTHINAEQAVHGFIDLGAKHFIPMHWGTFAFGTDHFEDPIYLLNATWKKLSAQLTDKMLHRVRVGQLWHLFKHPLPFGQDTFKQISF